MYLKSLFLCVHIVINIFKTKIEVTPSIRILQPKLHSVFVVRNLLVGIIITVIVVDIKAFKYVGETLENNFLSNLCCQ